MPRVNLSGYVGHMTCESSLFRAV